MLIIDGDYPMTSGALRLNRDLTLPLEAVRAMEPNSPNTAMASLPELRRAEIAIALVKVCARIERPGSSLPGYRSGEIAYAAAQGGLAYYRILEARGETRILTTRQDVRQHMQLWAEANDYSRLPVGMILGLEGADPILWPEQVEEWWQAGLRVISLTHYGQSTYAHGTGRAGGLLSPAGALLREMDRLGLVLDLTHISDEGFWQALDQFGGPVIATHQNCRALVPGERQFSDEQILALVQRGGVIGAAMDTLMLYPEGVVDWGAPGDAFISNPFPREAVRLEHFVDHIDHVCQLAGNSLHAAIGGDTDGQGGKECAPYEIDTVADYQKIGDLLAKRGYSVQDITNILHANWQRFFETWLPA